MNEITTEERLRIVEELNRTANDSLGGESLQRALARITGAEDTSWRGVMRRVAELADCIQACANMMAWMGLTQQDVDNAMLRCLKRNRDRGRIDAPWLA